jgi:hypothetical protein
MKKILLSLLILVTLVISSCGGKSTEEQINELCDCLKGIYAIVDESESIDESELDELKKRIKAKGDECNEMEIKLLKDKSEKQKNKINNELEKNCEVVNSKK